MSTDKMIEMLFQRWAQHDMFAERCAQLASELDYFVAELAETEKALDDMTKQNDNLIEQLVIAAERYESLRSWAGVSKDFAQRVWDGVERRVSPDLGLGAVFQHAGQR